MNQFRNDIKANAEKIPFLMVLFFAVCSLCTKYDFYFYGYKTMQNICEISLLFCFFMWLYSEKWSFVARKSLATLVALNILNIVNEFFPLENYYFYFQMLIYTYFATITIFKKCKKQ